MVVSTHLKNISQFGSFPQTGVTIKNIWNHQPVYYAVSWGIYNQPIVEVPINHPVQMECHLHLASLRLWPFLGWLKSDPFNRKVMQGLPPSTWTQTKSNITYHSSLSTPGDLEDSGVPSESPISREMLITPRYPSSPNITALHLPPVLVSPRAFSEFFGWFARMFHEFSLIQLMEKLRLTTWNV